ncbi:3-oxoacyl-[acyl-carrier-protein] synthase III C-terminal domain-containing protein [Pseudonocardia hispaniensis]|uniref:3-oxoacyl-[acyl-carrier-protein] synthase III C-terminal domain-containing protein n=1 Tax=Pseudonocardia hispaniensis TaxID=904933 RepID=A0ABW1J6U9_9PSEU
MEPFVINRLGRLVFPATVLAEVDFSVIDSLERLTEVVTRDCAATAPTGSDILARIEAHAYSGRYDLLRDIGQNLYWVNRYSMIMFEKRPTRWRDLPRSNRHVFLPSVTPWQEGARTVAAVADGYHRLPATWDSGTEDRIFGLLFDVFRNRRHHATVSSAIQPTVAQFLAAPDALTIVLPGHDPDYPTFGIDEILDCGEEVPELEALMRCAMVLHDQYPWDRSTAELRPVSRIGDDDFVVALHPRTREVAAFIDRVTRRRRPSFARRAVQRPAPGPALEPVRPYPPVRVGETFAVRPKLEALAIVRGEHVCDNADVIRNASYSWSPMTAGQIAATTGIERRRYTARDLADLALDAARAAVAHAGRIPQEIGAVLVSTCTSTQLIPSIACWLSGELGLRQTHAAFDLVASCAGLPYGLAEALRLLQEVDRPVVLVCAEKFSDKIGAVRTPRMIFGDGAAALVVAPAGPGEPGDVDVVQTYTSGPWTEVNSIRWPNPAFDNDITVCGPEVRSLVRRYLAQMFDELCTQPDPDAPGRSLLAGIDLIVPHQANRTIVESLAREAGFSVDRLYFNISEMGNVSAASIPIALFDAIRDGVLDRPMRVFAPGFGAGAVSGYAVLRVDPAIAAPEVIGSDVFPVVPGRARDDSVAASWPMPTTTDDMRIAFGE